MLSEPSRPTTANALVACAVAYGLAAAGCTNASSTPLPPPPPPVSGGMFITDFTNNSISGYGQGANCNCAPAVFIQGGNTGLSGPQGIAIDTSGNLYVANQLAGTITKYPGSASGNASPSFTIGGLASPVGIAVDPSGKVYVSNSAAAGVGTMSLQIYPRGSATPSQTIAGVSTGLSTPGYLALDSGGNIWVANQTGSIEEFARSATGNVAPIAVIAGNKTLLNRPQGIAFDSTGRLYVAINSALGALDAVLVFSPPLSGNIAPTNIACGVNTGINNPTGVAVNPQGSLFVVNSAVGATPGYLTVFAPNNIGGGANCTGPFPNAVLSGANTSLRNPTGIALN